MSKDPAFLFYPSDWIVGTAFMSYDQKGKYIDLLCLQHQHGPLSAEQMLKICGTYDKDVYDKFPLDTSNSHVNHRLSTEKDKREKFCNSRRNNRLGKTKEKLSTE